MCVPYNRFSIAATFSLPQRRWRAPFAGPVHLHFSMQFRTFALGAMLSFGLVVGVAAALADDLREVTRLHQAGQASAALERADRALAANPKDAQMRFLKSVVLADAGRRPEAISLLQELVQDYPELAEPHNNLAVLHAAAGDYAKARAELEETLRLNPNFAPAHENLGDVYVRLAGESYARALLAEPASATLPKKLAIVRQLNLPTLAASR